VSFSDVYAGEFCIPCSTLRHVSCKCRTTNPDLVASNPDTKPSELRPLVRIVDLLFALISSKIFHATVDSGVWMSSPIEPSKPILKRRTLFSKRRISVGLLDVTASRVLTIKSTRKLIFYPLRLLLKQLHFLVYLRKAKALALNSWAPLLTQRKSSCR
jgi:hypothetical protein